MQLMLKLMVALKELLGINEEQKWAFLSPKVSQNYNAGAQ